MAASLLALAGATHLSAYNSLPVTAADAEGNEVKKLEVTSATVIKFGKEGVEFHKGDATVLPEIVKWGEFSYLDFPSSGTGVVRIDGKEKAYEWSYADGILWVKGANPCTGELTVYSTDGKAAARYADFNGSADVSALSDGVYVAVYLNSSIKFYKK